MRLHCAKNIAWVGSFTDASLLYSYIIRFDGEKRNFKTPCSCIEHLILGTSFCVGVGSSLCMHQMRGQAAHEAIRKSQWNALPICEYQSGLLVGVFAQASFCRTDRFYEYMGFKEEHNLVVQIGAGLISGCCTTPFRVGGRNSDLVGSFNFIAANWFLNVCVLAHYMVACGLIAFVW